MESTPVQETAAPAQAPAQTNTAEGAQPTEQIYLVAIDNERDFDAVIKKAHEFLNKSNYDECLLNLEAAQKWAYGKFGESSYEAAKCHFEIGNALLQKVESSRDVFGEGIKPEAPQAEQDKIEEEGEGEGEDNSQETGVKNLPEANQEAEGNKEVGENKEVQANKEESEMMEMVTTKETEEVDKKDLVEIVEEQDSLETAATLLVQDIKVPQVGEEKEEDVDDLQVAWEQMEVARVILEKLVQAYDAGNPDQDEGKVTRHTNTMKALGHVMLRLGDANCFREDFANAIQDYGKCLQLRKFTEDSFLSRDLAEIHYLLGNAHLYTNTDDCDDIAIEHFNKARIILENLLHKQMNSSNVKDPEDKQAHLTLMSREFLKTNPFETEKSKELKEILGDLYNKIEDTNEQKKERKRVNAEMEKAKIEAQKASTFDAFSKPTIAPQENADGTTEAAPAPKIINLGKLGNAKKRTREDMEKPVAEMLTKGDEENKNGADLQNPNTSGKATQVDEQGHIEKMAKI